MNLIQRQEIDSKLQTQYAGQMGGTYKNPCTSAVAYRLGVFQGSRYLQTMHDLIYNIRKEYTVRSRASMFRLPLSVSQACRRAKTLTERVSWYIIFVDGHVLLMDSLGRIEVDTSPRKSDRRKVLGIWAVY